MTFATIEQYNEHQRTVKNAIESFQSTLTAMEPDLKLLPLDKHELGNLFALLHLIYQVPGVPGCLANGDWAGQLYWKLAALTGTKGFDPAVHQCNMTPELQLKSLEYWKKT